MAHSRQLERRRLTNKFLPRWGFIIMTGLGSATAGEIRHNVFQTQNTFLAPEINIVLYNDKDYSRKFTVDFGASNVKSPAANRHSCLSRKPVAVMNGLPFDQWDPSARPRPYGAFERSTSMAVIPAKSFVHRYYPVGFFSGMPCEITLTITDQADGQKIVNRIVVTKPSQEEDVEPDDVSVTATAESQVEDKRQLVTILVKNNAAKPVAFRLVRKMLLDCDADISDSLVKEGMEGSFVRIEKHSYAAVLTAINLRSGAVSKDCRLSAEFQAVAPLSRHHPLRQVTVPLPPERRAE
ncbi:hypothetical protein INH39_27280 [Massilia violaceinigra]|uniref:CARDB domain-containing protein n=1 Tax=Massilia violaceinigra TaxID=2045208 RepID=A0ABY4A5Z4_9BURK|nr:hypothetical protein [Massilia violaceinigra]UOD29084.1 hypothetical protein INH39_27280 [Massilia violaceinigra]